MERIGWIGTGVMGKSMCLHVLKKGYGVSVHNQTKEKTDDLCRQGAAWFDTPGDVAAQSDIVFTMVGEPADVAEALALDQRGEGEQACERCLHDGKA